MLREGVRMTASLDVAGVRAGWQRLYQTALDADVWGQADEAQSAYDKLAHSIAETLPPPPTTEREGSAD